MTSYGKRQLLCWVILVLSLGPSTLSYGQARFVTTRGKEFISLDGKSLLLKGINLGNWLLPEGYMFKFKTTNSPRLIQTTINELICEEEARIFWKTYRYNYITQADIRFIKRSGFNSVRIPFNYRLFVTDETSTSLDGPGYELLDRVVS